MSYDSLSNRIGFVLKFLRSNLGKRLVKNISDETLYSLIGTGAEKLGFKRETLVAVFQMLDAAKGQDETWGMFLTNSENLDNIQELLNEFQNLVKGSDDDKIL